MLGDIWHSLTHINSHFNQWSLFSMGNHFHSASISIILSNSWTTRGLFLYTLISVLNCEPACFWYIKKFYSSKISWREFIFFPFFLTSCNAVCITFFFCGVNPFSSNPISSFLSQTNFLNNRVITVERDIHIWCATSHACCFNTLSTLRLAITLLEDMIYN